MFNKNIFKNLNNKYGFNFDEKSLNIKAFFNSEKSRVEMHLISKVDHSVKIFDEKINFISGESIHTENSYKYTYKFLRLLWKVLDIKYKTFILMKNTFLVFLS